MVIALYLLGSVVLISGAASLASALGAAPTLVTVCAGVLLGTSAAASATAFAGSRR